MRAWPTVVFGEIEGFHRLAPGAALESIDGGKYAASAAKARKVSSCTISQRKVTLGDGYAVMILVGQRMGLVPMLVEDARRQLEGVSIHPMTAAAMEKEAIILNDRLRHDAVLIDKANIHAEHIKAEYGFACELSKEAFLELQAEAENLELAHASGQELPEHVSRLRVIEKLMNAASWTLHPDYGCILKSEVNARDRADIRPD